MAEETRPTYFATAAAWRKWLAANHAEARELWVGFHKRSTGSPSITWPESVDQALCYGWIDGVRKSIDASSYRIRFTPRRRGSIWSQTNIARMQALLDAGLVADAGREAFALRLANKSGIYAYEQRSVELPAQYARVLRANPRAWRNYRARPPSYRKTVNWWVVSAKREPTRESRLRELIEACERGTDVRAMPAKKP
jgi:uncharacterized protein YdeI (YjbR/CyaY-like superfamily)